MDITRFVAAQAIRFVAASQSSVALLMHGAWLLLAAATSKADGGSSSPAVGAFLRLFAWLGGIGPDGRGDGGNVVQAMALLTVPIYVIAAIRARRDAPRAPFLRTVVRWTVASGVVAFAGFGFAFWRGGGLTPGEIAWLTVLFGTIAAVATAWAVAADRVGDLLADRAVSRTPAEPGRPGL